MTPAFNRVPKSAHSKHSPRITPDYRELTLHDSYACPICQHGEISSLALMDAFACNFCRHIFAVNVESQAIEVVDSSQPMTWRWSGRNWQVARQEDANVRTVIWLIAVAIVLLPPLVVGLSVYTFPPLPNSPLSWFPVAWVVGTFILHLTMVTWLLVEHYQFPRYVAFKIRLRELFERRA
ncbi:MAG: hypothetical protein KME20_22295 [Kaiparowitsia implicata GSE-PSE-MK54-09C]|nr:hypothetical protein [Kaiparowitsia implicata GSE-PSE-MK54-09C]